MSIIVVAGSNPAAGVEFTLTVPASKEWVIYAVYAQLVTGADQDPRFPVLTIDDGATVVWQAANTQAQGASVTAQHSWARGHRLGQVGSLYMTPLLPGTLAAGYRIRSVTENLDAADDWGAPVVLVDETTV